SSGVFSPEEVELGSSIVLDASRSNDNVGISSYEWRVTHKTVTNTFFGVMVDYPVSSPGPYHVVLVVKDAAGNEDITTSAFTVPPKESVSETPGWLLPLMAVGVVTALIISFFFTRWYFDLTE
ncbi:MAG: hypothetical protein JSW25_04455, partial [Thermoplasmata archaeon]